MSNDAPVRSIRKSAQVWSTTVTSISVVAILIAIAAFAMNMGGGTSSSGGVAASGGTKEIAVSLKEFSVTPAKVEVDPGTTLVLKVTNDGAMDHDLKLDGKTGTRMLKPGESETVTVGPISQTSKAWCTVPGHLEAGMKMDIIVNGGGGTAATPVAGSTDGPLKTIDANATPSADWKPFNPELAPAPGGKEHKITLEATEKVLEIAPGVKQEMWTFNDQVPGPTLRGKVGDIFTVTLVNKGKVGHSIDFHASQTNMDSDMRTIGTGESLVYQFEAKHSGIWMYHCGTAPTLHHIGNGMFGAVIIDPPNLPKVDKEYVVVQSELYLSADGGPGPLDRMLADKWDAVVFNGYYNQYKFAPITSAKAGERVRVWILDAGPSENMAFHIVGTQFDTVFKEGAYLLRPGNPEVGGSQTLDLQPSQGGFVELVFPKDGTYAMVTHKFSSASKGALGLFHVGNVPETPGGGHSGH